jgi:hypothetical protein
MQAIGICSLKKVYTTSMRRLPARHLNKFILLLVGGGQLHDRPAGIALASYRP